MAANASMYSGDKKTLEITITNSAGSAVNLAGATITYVIVNHRTGETLITKTLSSGISVGGASNNVVSVTLNAADTASLEGVYMHELEIIDSSGNTSTAMQGTLLIQKEYA